MSGVDVDAEAEVSPDDILITLTHRNVPFTLAFDPSSTISDLSTAIESDLSIPASTQKLLVPKHGLQKPPFKDPNLPLSALAGLKIQLLAPPASELASFQAASTLASKRAQARSRARRSGAAKAASTSTGNNVSSSSSSRASQDAQYTFLTLRPLPGLPNPSRSLAYLERLKADPGIRSAMRTHRFTVPLLTEMEPLSNTSASRDGSSVSRLLGLNRNHGEVIELRLRTDAHDGYRDYATVRKTLCHELAHNVHGDHDRNFWDLCKKIEKEVEAQSGGRTMGDEGYTFAPARGGEEDEDGFVEDHGGWQGGEFVVGGREPGAPGSGSGSGSGAATQGLSRREILARAAEERMRKMNMETPDGSEPDTGTS